jgi:diguanylate cyclase (GGDEF)-like protein
MRDSPRDEADHRSDEVAGAVAAKLWRSGGVAQQGLALAAIAFGLLGLAGYFLKLDLVFGWQFFARLSPYAAAGVGVLGIVLWLQARRGGGGGHGRGILSTVAAALALVTIVAGVMSFAFMQQRVEQMTTESLVRLQSDRARLFTNIILQQTLLASRIAALPATVAAMRRLQRAPDDPAARAELQEIVRGYLPGGSAWVAFYREGRLLAEAGSAIPQPEMTVALRGSIRRELLWSQGFHLRTRFAVRDKESVLGEVVMERSLDVLTLLTADANQWGETGEMMLCALDADPFRCFPGRFLSTAFTVPRGTESQPSLVAQALQGDPGVIAAEDFRGQQVLAAYGPVGNYGLGMVVKMDRAELYAPVRRQLQIVMLSLALIVALSLWLVHGRVRPLLRQLVESQQAAQANEARFLAAAENSPDAFYILDSVRDAGRRIVDFRITYVNENGAKLFTSLPKERLLGQRLCEAVPLIREGGFFDKYKRVAETGETLLEEFQTSSSGLSASWLSHQVVRLGDGVAITSRDISERKVMEERFKYMAQNDALTGLPNRALFLDRLAQAIARARRHKQPMALMFLDVDHFKGVNDTLGHAAGDELLRTFAERLKGCVRRTDTVARLGGDEFTIILEDLKAEQDSATVAKKIAAALLPPIKLAEREVTITSSIGIANYFDAASSELSPGSLLEQADQALYAAKRRGRNGYALYTPDLEGLAKQVAR